PLPSCKRSSDQSPKKCRGRQRHYCGAWVTHGVHSAVGCFVNGMKLWLTVCLTSPPDALRGEVESDIAPCAYRSARSHSLECSYTVQTFSRLSLETCNSYKRLHSGTLRMTVGGGLGQVAAGFQPKQQIAWSCRRR